MIPGRNQRTQAVPPHDATAANKLRGRIPGFRAAGFIPLPVIAWRQRRLVPLLRAAGCSGRCGNAPLLGLGLIRVPSCITGLFLIWAALHLFSALFDSSHYFASS